jgi:DNA-binding response OmpR family regulator
MLVLLATPTLAGLEGFTKGIMDSGAELVHARSGMAALEMTKLRTPALVVVDADLHDFRPFELVSQLARVNAMVNTAVMSGLAPEQFHDDSEGLGVLAQLPPHPAMQDATALMDRLKHILGVNVAHA